MAETKNQAKQKMSRPVRKSASDRRVFVVKDGIRKARSIRKFQDTYYVGLAYVGLAELTLTEDEPNWSGGGKQIHKRAWTADLSAEAINGINVMVSVRIDSSQSVIVDARGFYTDLQRENMEGITENTFTFDLEYGISDATRDGRYRKVFWEHEVGNYYSIEDCLDAIAQMSEEAWGDVTVALRDYQDEYKVYVSAEEYYPDTVSIQLPTGEPLILDKKGQYSDRTKEGNWNGVKVFFDESAQIKAQVNVNIRAVVMKDGEYTDEGWDFANYPRDYSVSRDSTPEYYAVQVRGEIKDLNTQTNSSRGGLDRADSWQRDFEGEGAETLEGAIAIVESNVAEIYQEYQDYLASERNYTIEHNGTGYRNTTVNTVPWEYNYGDTSDDSNYDIWQDTSQDYYALNGGEGFDAFVNEYIGSNRYGILDYNYDNPRTFYPSTSSYREEERKEIMETYTKENVERACQMSGCTLIDYQDPLNFTISANARLQLSRKKNVRKSKMPYAYYDVEVRKLQRQGLVKSKQAQPKSFNDMVKSIRAKNNQHKRKV